MIFSRPETIPQSFYSNSPVGSQSTESPLTTTPSKAKLPKKDKAGKKKLRNESISEVKNAQSVSQPPQETKPVSEQKHISADNIVWNGDVLPDHLIESTGGAVTINGNVGQGAIVKSKFNLTINGDAEEKARLYSERGAVSLKRAHDDIFILSSKSHVSLDSVGNFANIKAGDYIEVQKDIGSDCTVFSKTWVSAKKVGARTTLIGKEGISADVLSENSKALAIVGEVNARRVEDKSSVFAKSFVLINEFAAESAALHSEDYGIAVVNGRERKNKSVVDYGSNSKEKSEADNAVKSFDIYFDNQLKLINDSFSSAAADSKPNVKKEINKAAYNDKPSVTESISIPGKRIEAELYTLKDAIGKIAGLKWELNSDQNGRMYLKIKLGNTSYKNIFIEDLPNESNLTVKLYEEEFDGVRVVDNKPESLDNEEPFVSKSILIKNQGHATIIVEKTPGRENDIVITPTFNRWETGASIRWNGKYKLCRLQPGTYRLNATTINTDDWEKNPSIYTSPSAQLSASSMSTSLSTASMSGSTPGSDMKTSQQSQPSSISSCVPSLTLNTQISNSVSSSSTSSRLSSFSQSTSSYYSSPSSPTMYRGNIESKHAEPAKLPTVEKLNQILGIPGLVENVYKGAPHLGTACTIYFNRQTPTSSYESLVNGKLLAGIPGVNIDKSYFTSIVIPAAHAERFIQNYESALKEINESGKNYRMGN